MRLSIPLLIIAASLLQGSQCHACRLTDWLRGRNTPYVVGYAPAAYAPYTAAYTPYTAAYTPAATSSYLVGYATAAPAASSLTVARPAANPAAVLSNGAYQAQRPAYLDNPSVYTGLPVTPNAQAAYRVPAPSPFRGTLPAAAAYPSAYVSAYPGTVSPGQPVTTTVPTGTPATALPATPVAPLFPSSPPPRRCGLGRFFAGLFGTSYNTSYYRAPITYYRPVTSIDPVSGTTVTVQQPCTSYVQQIQRTPRSSVQVGQPGIAPSTSSCPSGNCGASPYAATAPYPQSSPYAAPPTGAIGQVGAVGSTGQTVPIPSAAPPAMGGYYGQGGYTPAPLTGPPPASAQPGTGDLSPVEQPRLENATPPTSLPRESIKPSADNKPLSYWQLQNADDSRAMIRPESSPGNSQRSSVPDANTDDFNTQDVENGRDPVSLSESDFTSAEPIRAPADYVSPFRQGNAPAPAARPVTRQIFKAPPLPPPAQDSSAMTSASARSSVVPARSAALLRDRVQRKPVELKRDSTWYTIQP